MKIKMERNKCFPVLALNKVIFYIFHPQNDLIKTSTSTFKNEKLLKMFSEYGSGLACGKLLKLFVSCFNGCLKQNCPVCHVINLTRYSRD